MINTPKMYIRVAPGSLQRVGSSYNIQVLVGGYFNRLILGGQEAVWSLGDGPRRSADK